MPQAYFRFQAGIVGRGTGRGVKSALVAAAYRTGQKLHFEREDQMIDYTRRKGVVMKDVLAPADAPAWVTDREVLWNTVEKIEKRHDARLARDFTLSLPHQFNFEQMEEAVTGFLESQFVSRGLVCDYAVHAPGAGDDRNYHAHALVTERAISEEGFSATKDRGLTERSMIEEWRKSWEFQVNRILIRDQICDRNGELYFVDRRSYAEQGLDRETGIHLGPAATKLERSGIATEAGNVNRAVKARNEERHWLHEAANEVAERIQLAERQIEKERRYFAVKNVTVQADQSDTELTRKPKSRGWDLER